MEEVRALKDIQNRTKAALTKATGLVKELRGHEFHVVAVTLRDDVEDIRNVLENLIAAKLEDGKA